MSVKNKGGRPSLSSEEKRDQVIKFSCTKAERDFFQQHAERAGYKQTARFLHDVCIAVINNGGFSYNEQTQVNAQLIAALIGLANNVNQAMHRVHVEGTDQFPELHQSLNDAQDVIYTMAQIAQLGVRRECKIKDKAQGVQYGDA